MVGKRIAVTGRVQGVSFRFFTQRAADELRLDGWVRNRLDGSVEIEVWGEHEVVQQLLSRVREGPPQSRVEKVVERELSGDPPVLSGFHVGATA